MAIQIRFRAGGGEPTLSVVAGRSAVLNGIAKYSHRKMTYESGASWHFIGQVKFDSWYNFLEGLF